WRTSGCRTSVAVTHPNRQLGGGSRTNGAERLSSGSSTGTSQSRRTPIGSCGQIREVRVTTSSRPSVQDVDPSTLEAQRAEQPEADRPRATRADIVVKGRNVEVPDHYRIYVSEKLSRLERFDPSIFLFDVELFHERNRRQRKACQRVEITARGKGPVVRAE